VVGRTPNRTRPFPVAEATGAVFSTTSTAAAAVVAVAAARGAGRADRH